MRTASFLAFILITSIALTVPVTASPPAQGGSETITDTVSWTEDGNFDGEVIVKSGGELHWSGDISVKQNSHVRIEEGGTLHLDSAMLVGENAASTLLIYDGSEIVIDENIADSSATMTLFFNIEVPETAFLNLTIDDVTTGEITGDSASFTVDLSQAVDIVIEHYYPLYLGITHVELFHSNAELRTINADEIQQTGGNLIWNQASFKIENHGTLIIDASTILGANITCDGACSVLNSDLHGSGPIHVTNGNHIDVIESTMLGSRTDEDIILHDQATIEYTNSSGTGGYTDAWIRLLSKRELSINAPTATVVATGIGYGGNTINTIINGDPNDSSTWVVDIGTNEHKRIVEWLDGSGAYGEESGTIKVTVETNWGNFVADTTAPRLSSAAIEIEYPTLNIDKIEPEAVTADTGRSHGVMVTVSNTGTIAVDPNVRCYVDDVEADTTASTANWAVEPGQTKDVPITWYHNSDGAVQLTCKFLYPDVLEPVQSLIANEQGTTSGEVSWTTAEEVEELPIVLYGAIILLVVVLAAAIGLRASKEISKDYIAEETYVEQEDHTEENVTDEPTEEWLDAEGNPIISNE